MGMVGGGVGALPRARPCSRQRGATCFMQGGAGVRRTCWPPHTVVLCTWWCGSGVPRIGVCWEGLAPLRGFLTRPQMVPATGKVGGSAADLQEGGLVDVVEWVLDTGVIEHLGRVDVLLDAFWHVEKNCFHCEPIRRVFIQAKNVL